MSPRSDQASDLDSLLESTLLLALPLGWLLQGLASLPSVHIGLKVSILDCLNDLLNLNVLRE